ncbi:MAG: cyclase [Nocardioidaceae bacterium]|nr:cyclase [Nocardioidaceae bacterium]
MARTTGDIVIDASAPSIMAVIADFSSYPSWATGVDEAVVIEEGVGGRADLVRFSLNAPPIRDGYVLRYQWKPESVTWTLDEKGSMLVAMDGAYLLAPEPSGGTRVTYQLAVDVSIPLLGMLKRKAEKVIIDTALKGLKARVEGA